MRQKKNGATVRIYDGNHAPTHVILQDLEAFRPNVLALSTFFKPDCFANEQYVADALRGKAMILVGGADASTNDLVINELRPNIAIRGEGELAVSELTRNGFDPKKLPQDQFSIHHIGESWVIGPQATYNIDLLPLGDSLPEIFRGKERWTEATVNVGRGCASKCTFCIGGKQVPHFMTAGRTVEQILSWLPMIYKNSTINLLAPDFTAVPKRSNDIIRAINSEERLNGLNIFFAVCVDSMSRALAFAFEDGRYALNEWRAFLGTHKVTIEIGVETLDEDRLGKDHLKKTPNPEKYNAKLYALLQLASETGTKVIVDLISFDPDVTLGQLREDYGKLLALSKTFPCMEIGVDGLFRELVLYPGTKSSIQSARTGFILTPGKKEIPLKAYRDKRVKSLLQTLRENRPNLLRTGITTQQILARINRIIKYFESNFTDPNSDPDIRLIDRFFDQA